MIYYQSAADEIRKIIENEKIQNLDSDIIDEILEFASSICSYEEEEIKIYPKIIIGNNLDFFFQQIPGLFHKTISIISEMNNFLSKIKNSISICNKDWYVYIDIGKKDIEYGFCKLNDDLTSASIEDLIYKSSYDENDILEKSFIIIKYISRNIFQIRGIRKSDQYFSFSLKPSTINLDLPNLAKCLLTRVEDNNKEAKEQFFIKLFENVRMKVHGCICLVIDSEKLKAADITRFRKSSNWLTEPIDFGKIFDTVYQNKSNEIGIISIQNYVEITLELISQDGITIFDNSGRLLAFNYFVKGKIESRFGGARRRAAESIIENPNEWDMGLYFQSQDGYSYFKEISHEKEETPI